MAVEFDEEAQACECILAAVAEVADSCAVFWAVDLREILPKPEHRSQTHICVVKPLCSVLHD